MPKTQMKKLVFSVITALALAGCGSDNNSDNPAQPTDPEKPAPQREPKTLIIGMDGMRYDALLAGIEQKTLPNLATLNLTRAWTGGTLSAGTQQSTLLTPGWATLLTGTWVPRHEVRSDSLNQQTRVATLFEQVKTAQPDSQTGSAVNSASLASLLGAERDAGYLDSLTNCAQMDACVTDAAGKMVGEGYDVILAQYAAPLSGLRSPSSAATYKATLEQTDKALGTLLQAVNERRSAHPGEDWQVIVTTSTGLGDGGNYDGLPRTSSKTIFFASNMDAMLGGDKQAQDLNAAWDSQWEALPAATDLAPTVIAHLDAATVSMPAIDGSDLAQAGTLRRPHAKPAEDYKSVTISWSTIGEAPANITILRNGEQIATLTGDVTSYVDNSFAFEEDGLHTLAYEIRTPSASLATSAQIPYTQDVLLDRNLKVGLTMFYSFEQGLSDVGGQTSIVAYDGVQQPKFISDGPFGNAFRAERKDRSEEKIDIGGYKLQYPEGALDQFNALTIGLWYRSRGEFSDRPILSNKNYTSGGNPGLTIAQWNGNEVRFNIAGGSRTDLNGFYFTPNKWAYLILSIDKTNKKMTAAVYDPENGLSVRSTATGSVDLQQLDGVLGAHIGINEDGLGNYALKQGGSPSKGAYDMDIADLTMWSRALSEEEIRSLALSGKSVRELLQ